MNKIIIGILILLSVVLLINPVEAYSFNRPTSYYFNTSVDEENSSYSFQSVMNLYTFYSRYGNNRITFYDTNISNSIELYSEISGSYFDYFYLGTDGFDIYYHDDIVDTEILLSTNGLDVYDSSKPNGYVCWYGGYLISSVTPCGS